MSMTATCFLVSYVPFAFSVTFVANTVLEVASRGGSLAVEAAADQQRRSAAIDVMSPFVIAMAVIFWTVVGVAFYRYSECCSAVTNLTTAAATDKKQQSSLRPPPPQTAEVSAKRKTIKNITS